MGWGGFGSDCDPEEVTPVPIEDYRPRYRRLRPAPLWTPPPQESIETFVARERVYPYPAVSTPEESVKAGLKAHRQLDRIRISSREETATGRAVSEWLTWLLDLWTRADVLPPVQREIVRLYFLTSRPPHERGAQDCESCEQHYGNPQIARRLGLSTRQVARLKRQAILTIADHIWPEGAASADPADPDADVAFPGTTAN